MSIYRVLIDADDEKGLVHKISGVFYNNNLNIISNSEFVDNESNKFFMRSVVEGDIELKNLKNLKSLTIKFYFLFQHLHSDRRRAVESL